MIKKLFDYYLAHQDELVKKYNGKYLVITENGVDSAWNPKSDKEAYFYAEQKLGLGNFILQLCTPGTSAYTFYNHHIA